MLKKLAIWGMVLVLLFSLMGCSQKEETSTGETTESSESTSESTEEMTEESDKVVIGWALSNFNDKWLSYMLDAAQAEAEALGDKAEVIFVDAKDDSAVQLGQIENFVAQGVDAIAVIPVNTDATKPITDLCKEAGIPLISVNRSMATQEDATSLVGSDSIISGILQMEYLGEQMGGTGKLVIMRGGDGHEAAIARTEGVKQVIEENGWDIEIVAEQTAKWDRAEGMRVMENWIQSGLEFDALAANNDEMAIGAIMALEDAGMLDQVMVAGIDGAEPGLTAVNEGKMACTVFQDAMGQGAGSIQVAYQAAIGEAVEPVVWIPYELVTPENVSEYMAKWGME